MRRLEDRLIELEPEQVKAILPLITVKVRRVFIDLEDEHENFSFWRFSTNSKGEKIWYQIGYKSGVQKYDLHDAIT